MPDLSRVRLVQGQGGSTLIELLVAMPIAVALLGLVTQAFVTGAKDHRIVERRAAAVSAANTGLERMTRELRQANWVYFTSSQIVDVEAMVRPNATTPATVRHVRYDCSRGACWRHEGPAVSFPPPAGSTFTASQLVIGSTPGDASSLYGRVVSNDVFVPKRVDPTTGRTVVDYLRPDLLHISLRLMVQGLSRPIEIADGVSLRNTTKFAG